MRGARRAAAAAVVSVLVVGLVAAESHAGQDSRSGDDRAGDRWRTTALAVSPDGERVYQGDDGFIHWTKADGTTELSSFPVGSAIIRDLAVSPNGRTLFATSDDGNLYAINTVTASVQYSVRVGEQPNGLDLSADGRRAYVANFGSGTLSVVDVSDTGGRVVATVDVGPKPWDVAVNPRDGSSRVYVAMREGNLLVQVDAVNNVAINPIDVGSPVTAVDTNSTGTLIIAATDGTDSLTLLDASNAARLGNPAVGKEPYALAVAPGDAYVYVLDRAGSAIAEVSLAAGGQFPVRVLPIAGIDPDRPAPLAISPTPQRPRLYYGAWAKQKVVRVAVLPFRGPGKVRKPRATAGVRSATIRWKPPASTGSAPVIIGYTVTAKPGGRQCTTRGRTTCTITRLEPGETYGFRVVARTALGPGRGVTSNAVTPTRPSAPTNSSPNPSPSPSPSPNPNPTPDTPIGTENSRRSYG